MAEQVTEASGALVTSGAVTSILDTTRSNFYRPSKLYFNIRIFIVCGKCNENLVIFCLLLLQDFQLRIQ